ncbi:hypothetical protein Pcinc_024673 [Petrolisthes cinctipes]|uniref:Uncharacterized protein n=1 Tax=Petrolisthes cinctipes TaxID=88211 RepID=A0AAE1FAC4_PETCI|nr:hypothetical protein Pcinc_024673 [Petrolisthes cinctipes]
MTPRQHLLLARPSYSTPKKGPLILPINPGILWSVEAPLHIYIAVALKTTAVAVPNCSVSEVTSCLDEAITQERRWIEDAVPHLETKLTCGDTIAWAAYHASIQPSVENHPALHALLPSTFYEKSATPAIIKHGMDVLRQAVEFLNPGQIPVTTFDQPLFALAKCIQWKWPDTHDEKVRVIMVGGVHTEMVLWNTLGDVLVGCGWTTALTEAGVASPGTANSYLKAPHLTRTKQLS